MLFAADAVGLSPSLLITGIVGLSSAVGIMWKVLTTQQIRVETRLSDKLEKCETKHESQHGDMLKLTGRVNKLEGMFEGHRQAREDLKGLSDYVLEHIHKESDSHDSASHRRNHQPVGDIPDDRTGSVRFDSMGPIRR